MTDPRILVLYVRHAGESAAFYASLLGKPPAESSPNFVMFRLDSGVQLGLWTAGMVQPPATAAGGSELCFMVENRAAVDARHAAWSDQGLRIVQPPTAMDFGYTFVALDPDGHRLRVFDCPAK